MVNRAKSTLFEHNPLLMDPPSALLMSAGMNSPLAIATVDFDV